MKKIIAITAALLFWGQSYGQDAARLRSTLPEIEGWTLNPETVSYSPESQCGNEGNPSQPLNDLTEVIAFRYDRGDEHIVVELYRHKNPANAFAIYSSERVEELAFSGIGGEANGNGDFLHFFMDSFYGKLTAFSDEDLTDELRTIGKTIASNIAPETGFPQEFSAFPMRDFVPYTETLNIIEPSGEHDGITMYSIRYEDPGNYEYIIILVDAGDTSHAFSILSSYVPFTRQAANITEGSFIIQYPGTDGIPLAWDRRYIVYAVKEQGDLPEDIEELLWVVLGSLDKAGLNR